MSTDITLESMRADIARMLHEDPADIADDDNLMDLGLDSMRTMTLASHWRDAGAGIEFSEMALNATLQHWWSLVRLSLPR
ncbi:phosphopantetheine-binding protein [Alcaligenaceae bacterium]|nr:phosphopantetheine-binding protein [Alcaligenaceae bacterium]